MSTRIVAALLVLAAAAACGKKGPPLAPFVRVPATVASVTVVRIGDEVFVSFPVPTANVDGQQPADLASLEVYAITATRPPETEEQRKLATLIATLPVRPILPAMPPAPEGVELPAVPLPPGIDRDTPAVVRETLAPEAFIAVELPPNEETEEVEEAEEAEEELVIGPLIAPAATAQPRRYYFVTGTSPRGRTSPASTPVVLPLDPASSAPGAPQVTISETGMTVNWSPSPDARSGAFEILPPPAPAATTPGGPVLVKPLPLLPARSLGFQSEATTYHLFEVPSVDPPEEPFAITVPVALTPLPLAVTGHAIAGVTFGVERCFVVRPVEKISGVTVMGPASPKTCVTPADTFPPAAPRSLAAIAGAGVISLVWDANTEADLAGYLVLRGDAPGDTLRALTPAPVAATTFRDTTVRPGERYIYVVVAVDRATPQNVSARSNRVEETAR